MDTQNLKGSIFLYFSQMQDFRINRKKQHLLADIIALTIVEVLSGMKSYNEIEDFGLVREAWLRTFFRSP